MKSNKKYINIFIIAIIMCVVGISFITYNFYINNKTPIYNYTIQRSDDYKVILKPNVFYETEILESGLYYAANSINSYNISLNYDFLGDKKTYIEYDYNIDAHLVGIVKNDDNQNKEVWNRKFILKENTHDKVDNIDKISINQEIDIDYQYYNNLARSYEKEYKITIDSILKIRLNIYYTINLNENIHKVEDFIELEIPITNTVSEVKENYERSTNGSIIQEGEYKNNIENLFYIIGGIDCVVSIIIMVFIMRKYIKTKTQQYDWKLNHILKYYKDIIITINYEPTFENLKIINISMLENLIDIAEQSQRNILYYKNINSGERKFFVIIDDYVYVYLLNNSDKSNKFE